MSTAPESGEESWAEPGPWDVPLFGGDGQVAQAEAPVDVPQCKAAIPTNLHLLHLDLPRAHECGLPVHSTERQPHICKHCDIPFRDLP